MEGYVTNNFEGDKKAGMLRCHAILSFTPVSFVWKNKMGCNKGKKKVTGKFMSPCVVFTSLADGMLYTEQLSDADSDDDFQKPIIIRKRKAKDKDGEVRIVTLSQVIYL